MKNLLIVFCVCFFATLLLPKKFFRKFDRMLGDTKTISTDSDRGDKYTSDPETMKYFNEITLKNEMNSKVKKIPKKYKNDVKIFVYGDYEQYMLDEVDRVVSDLNNIIDPIDVSITENRSESNMVVYFGDYETFISNNPDLSDMTKIKKCEGFFTTKSGGPSEIKSSRIFINLPKQDGVLDLKDCIREEITQSLGLFNDTYTYPESTFYGGQNSVLEYPEIDIKLIKMLYNE